MNDSPGMNDAAETRMARTLAVFDAANREDPQVVEFKGTSEPREYHFAVCVSGWIDRLVPQPSDALRLAARCHTMKRWEVPRKDYPMDLKGYRRWRAACARHHASEAVKVLRDAGYDDDMCQAVEDLILKKNWPTADEALALEDADCLAFIEMKFRDYLDEWDEEKTIRIVERTLRKMTPRARELAGEIALSDREKNLIGKAMRKAFG